MGACHQPNSHYCKLYNAYQNIQCNKGILTSSLSEFLGVMDTGEAIYLGFHATPLFPYTFPPLRIFLGECKISKQTYIICTFPQLSRRGLLVSGTLPDYTG